jgi:hypothetical protein
MRKIETEMVLAAKSHRNWKKDNTETVRCIGCTRVYLHGNEIAKVLDNGTVIPERITLKQWPTRTTLSRLWALGVDVYQRRHTIYLNGEPFCKTH